MLFQDEVAMVYECGYNMVVALVDQRKAFE